MIEYIKTTVVGLAISTIIYFLKQTMNRLQRVEDKMSDADKNHESKEQHDKDISEFKRQYEKDMNECRKSIAECRDEINKISLKYLEKEEFIRSMATIDNKFKRIEDKLENTSNITNKKLDRLLEKIYREE